MRLRPADTLARSRHTTRVALTLLAGISMASAGASAPPEDSCVPIAGLAPVFEPRTITLFGELHGTNEVPAFVANVLCHATARRLPVMLAIELPKESTAALRRYVTSAGTAGDRTTLLADAAWHLSPPDGRTSAAMLSLVETTRRLVAEGGDVDVFAFSDVPSGTQTRDSQMADILATRIAAESSRVAIVLTGNIHSRVGAAENYDSWARRTIDRPMGYLLRERLPGMKVLGLNVSYDEGAAWTCLSDAPPESACGPHLVKGHRQVASNSIEVTRTNGMYAGFFGVGALSASQPAVR
jgi:hypothetical protein